jgi:hypothetical protein
MLFRNLARTASRNVIAYTTHKAGSMVLHRVLKDISELNRIRYYSPNESKTALPFDRIFAGYDFIAKKRGCFGPIRFFVPTKALDEASIILHLRDPRDVLVSMFYSYCYMHAGEIERHTGYRREVAEAGIDKFVLEMVGEAFLSLPGRLWDRLALQKACRQRARSLPALPRRGLRPVQHTRCFL